MSRIHKLIVPIMLTMNLCACGSESIQKGSNIQNFEQNHYITHANTYQNGVIYTGSEGSSTAAYFLDYESMQAVPLCNKPNCAHKDTSCLAFHGQRYDKKRNTSSSFCGKTRFSIKK